MAAANDTGPAITDFLVDRAFEAMSAELEHWNIVGPLEERRTKPLPPREFWNAVRSAPSVLDAAPIPPIIIHLKSRQHAIACVQWHGLKAAIAAVMGELGPIPSSTDGEPNG